MMTIYSRQERIKQIVEACKTGTGRGEGLTMRQVARRIGLKPSGYVMGLMWEAADEGLIKAEIFKHRPNMFGWRFSA